jgi:MFS family permease
VAFLVDRWGARRVILGSDATRAVLLLGLATLLLLGHSSIAALFVIAAAFGVFDALFYPATSTVVPAPVSPDQLSAANGVWQAEVEGSMIVGPKLGGVIVGPAGPALAIDGASFLVAFVALLAIRASAPRRARGREVFPRRGQRFPRPAGRGDPGRSCRPVLSGPAAADRCYQHGRGGSNQPGLSPAG